MSNALYRKQLTSPEWKAKREECLNRSGRKCENCGSDKRLQVHHPEYLPGKKPWEYDNLQVLCSRCHSLSHSPKTVSSGLGGVTALNGKYFHEIKDNGLIGWQGQLLGHIQDGFYLVQLYSWLDGEPTNCEIVHFSDLCGGWLWYQNGEQMQHAYDYGVAKRFRCDVQNLKEKEPDDS